MIDPLAISARDVPEALQSHASAADDLQSQQATRRLVATLVRHRHAFGITRIGSITALDRIGLPVMQVTRPLALSNVVAQGKGMTAEAAAASALMETIELWAAERIAPQRKQRSTARALGRGTVELYRGVDGRELPAGWDDIELDWIDGWDITSRAEVAVPAALVDTVYAMPSPHPSIFQRSTTGLGGGATLRQAVIHAGLEILERDAKAKAHRLRHFFERHMIDLTTQTGTLAQHILAKIRDAGLVAGAWRVPAPHGLAVYWCHVMERDEYRELVPLPAEGSACDVSSDRALARALMEACQARLAAISGAREDITLAAYPQSYDRRHLGEWRALLATPTAAGQGLPGAQANAHDDRLECVVAALAAAGARAIIVVPLLADRCLGIHIARVVAPPLETVPGE